MYQLAMISESQSFVETLPRKHAQAVNRGGCHVKLLIKETVHPCFSILVRAMVVDEQRNAVRQCWALREIIGKGSIQLWKEEKKTSPHDVIPTGDKVLSAHKALMYEHVLLCPDVPCASLIRGCTCNTQETREVMDPQKMGID